MRATWKGGDGYLSRNQDLSDWFCWAGHQSTAAATTLSLLWFLRKTTFFSHRTPYSLWRALPIGIFIPIFNPLTCYPCRQPPFTLEFLDMCDHRKGFSNMHEIVYSWTYFFTYDKSSISMSSQLKPWFKKAFK